MIQLPAPRLEIDLDKVFHNALTLGNRLRKKGISVTGVTKATLGSPEIAEAWLAAGIDGLGDSRTENFTTLRAAKVRTPMSLIRTPMLSQVDQVVNLTNVSFNTELEVIQRLSVAAKKSDIMHEVILMVELGDLREGIMPALLEKTLSKVLKLPNILFTGIGTNLACRSGVSPDCKNMAALSVIADSLETTFGPIVSVVSGGNSANLDWALGKNGEENTGRINNLRLGESLLLGCEPLHRKILQGMFTTSFTLIAEVIELSIKPSEPWGEIAQCAFGDIPEQSGTNTGNSVHNGSIKQAILAIGRQDIDPEGLIPPLGTIILSASSDHLILDVTHYRGNILVGTEIAFQQNYSSLLRSMTSPFIPKIMNGGSESAKRNGVGYHQLSSSPS
ncbi:alanine/ornithine racemase family PLP-dependent enzyme [Akkermansiaceae bacterium]|nr:alanine/ornithine racemase family PLP-dependent enzyme [Akkermansiaceae bacterium]